MPLSDLTLDECRAFRPVLAEPDDFDAFWASTLREAAGHPLAPAFRRVDNGLRQIDSYEVSFAGADGHRVHGWLQLPAGARQPLGCVVEYLGYGRGRGLPHQWLFWAAAGYAHLVMDTRGQGWSASAGATPDPAPAASGPGAVPGFLTRGIESRENHYYRRVFTDAVRCVEAARAHPAVDPDRVVAAGVSQGGGISLAVAALVPDLAGVMADVPFLCHIRRGTEVAAAGPYTEVAEYLRLHRGAVRDVFATLAHFDGALMAARARTPALFSIALMDRVCPPSTCFSAYNAYAGPKDVRVYEFNDHEGGVEHHQAEQLAWLRSLVG